MFWFIKGAEALRFFVRSFFSLSSQMSSLFGCTCIVGPLHRSYVLSVCDLGYNRHVFPFAVPALSIH
jgi:hypothetical protein